MTLPIACGRPECLSQQSLPSISFLQPLLAFLPFNWPFFLLIGWIRLPFHLIAALRQDRTQRYSGRKSRGSQLRRFRKGRSCRADGLPRKRELASPCSTCFGPQLAIFAVLQSAMQATWALNGERLGPLPQALEQVHLAHLALKEDQLAHQALKERLAPQRSG